MNTNEEHDLQRAPSPFSPSQNLTLRTAVDKGLTLVLKKLASQMEGYRSLLEEDMAENVETRKYLDKVRKATEANIEWLNANQASLQEQTLPATESIDAVSLINGAGRRCSKIVEDQCQLEMSGSQEPVFVRGAMFELQECVMRSIMGSIYCLFPDAPELTIETTVKEFTDQYFDLFKSPCQAGSYVQMQIQRKDMDKPQKSGKPFVESIAVPQELPGAQKKLDLLEMYGILLDYGGDAMVETNNESFTRLTLLLPVEGTYEQVGVTGDIEDRTLKGEETILLVDDEDMIWDVIIDMLQELGYTVILAGDGNEAVEIYRENPEQIDLVILDMVMPGMDGHTAFFQLQELDPDVKVLLHSAYVSEEDARDVLDAGGVGFLQKPYRITDLARKIREVFSS